MNLSRDINAIVEFANSNWIAENPGAFTATKKLMRGLEKRGVSVRRVPAKMAKTFGIETRYRPIDRSIASVRGGSGAPPISEIWHEAGHDLTRSHAIKNQDRIQFNPVHAARAERMANRAAAHAMRKLGAPADQQAKYAPAVTKAYHTYAKPMGHFRKDIPRDPMAY